jgi:hypothetical protein
MYLVSRHIFSGTLSKSKGKAYFFFWLTGFTIYKINDIEA